MSGGPRLSLSANQDKFWEDGQHINCLCPYHNVGDLVSKKNVPAEMPGREGLCNEGSVFRSFCLEGFAASLDGAV